MNFKNKGCGCSTMVSAFASQARDEGSIPFTRLSFGGSCRPSSIVEQALRKRQVVGASPTDGSANLWRKKLKKLKKKS